MFLLPIRGDRYPFAAESNAAHGPAAQQSSTAVRDSAFAPTPNRGCPELFPLRQQLGQLPRLAAMFRSTPERRLAPDDPELPGGSGCLGLPDPEPCPEPLGPGGGGTEPPPSPVDPMSPALLTLSADPVPALAAAPTPPNARAPPASTPAPPAATLQRRHRLRSGKYRAAMKSPPDNAGEPPSTAENSFGICQHSIMYINAAAITSSATISGDADVEAPCASATHALPRFVPTEMSR